MKSINTIFVILISSITIAQQNNKSPRYIEINERTSFLEVDIHHELIEDTIYHNSAGFLIYPDYLIDTIDGDDYVIFTYPNYDGIRQQQQSIVAPLSTKVVHLDISNRTTGNSINGKVLAIKKDKFDELEKIDVAHAMRIGGKGKSISMTSGLLTAPFKIRGKRDSVNFNITTDITIGPYIGLTTRLSKRKPYYLTLPATLGLSFININDNTTSNEKFEALGSTIVPGVSWSVGIIFQLDSFDLGLIYGRDYASGVGRDWIYHDKNWLSFGIGYNFIKKKEK